jgi:hypothetical protein
VVGIQIGNEILGQQSAATISTVAQNLRSAHNAAGFNSIEVVGALIEGQASTSCPGGTPPTGVDYIADNVYCSVGSSGGVASAPPVWPSGNVLAQTCWAQVQGVSPRTRTRAGLRTSYWARPITTPAVQAFSSAAGSQCADVYQSDGQYGLSKAGHQAAGANPLRIRRRMPVRIVPTWLSRRTPIRD